VPHLDLAWLIDFKIDKTFEGLGFQMNMTVGINIEPQVNTFVDGKACHQTVLMINVCPQRAYTIWGKYVVLHILFTQL
jgi:NAD-dependent dihydropyrimidine dehydrogenase PreA subunit